jgi:glycine betaine transporter
MQTIISIALLTVLASAFLVVLFFGRTRVIGTIPTKTFAFVAILFTSGLDVGLIMFPMTEFPVYESEAAYGFANPLAIEFGFWGFLIWVFYFLTTTYFCLIEPKLQLFQIPWIKFLNNTIIIGTCSFTGFLFLSYLPSYIEGISELTKYSLVALVVFCAVFSSTDVSYVKKLSLASTWAFFALIFAMYWISDMGLSGFIATSANLGEYFTNIHKFVMPITDYHQFYLYWWLAWSIMIGQFVSRFTSDLSTLQLLLALTILPSIPIAVWFTVLYYFHTNSIEIVGVMKGAMVVVGIIFVINSLDSLTRLYTDNLNISVARLGMSRYVALNWTLIYSLILMFQFTPLKIEWVGLVVIFIYIVIYFNLIQKRKTLLNPQIASNSREK